MEIFTINRQEKIIEFLEKATKSVHGWMSTQELSSLYHFAKSVKGRGVIVEIGSWRGRSTIWIARGAKDGAGAKVYAIDPFTGSAENQKPGLKIWTFDDFKNNLSRAGVWDAVAAIIATSEMAAKEWSKPIEFLFIDGDHEYEAVEKDFLLYSPHVINGGVIAFHDIMPSLKAIFAGWSIVGRPGPRKVVEKYVFKSRKFKNINLIGSILYVTKCDNNSWVDRLKNKICRLGIVFNYLIYDFYLQLRRLPAPVKVFLKKYLK